MHDRAMAGEFLADCPIDAAFVSPEMRVFGDRINDDRLECRGSNLRDVVAADLAAALHKRHDGFLRRRFAISAVARLAASKGLVGFNELSFAAELVRIDFAHCLANAMG
jgi:hypothetical protein